jgi:hypothetical protein
VFSGVLVEAAMRKWLGKQNRSDSSWKSLASFKTYDNCRFVVRDERFGPEPLRGTARFQRDDDLGNILRIAIDGDFAGNPEIIVCENEWNGLITRDVRYGCDFCLFLASDE